MKIVLAHGVLGFGEVIPGNLQRLDYFNEVKEHLETRFPGIEVFAPTVDFKGSIETRGRQLAKAIRAINAPVHVIAHSMGGLDARWAIAHLPEETNEVLSLVTIGTPHRGSEVADAIAERRPPLFSALPGFVVAQLEALGPALADLTTARGAEFDEATADREGITYLEIAGDASHAGHEALLFQVAAMLGHLTGQPNDGVVTQASATRKGRRLFAIWPFDHGGEIGWSLDVLIPRFLRPRKHLPLYDAVVDELHRRHAAAP
ncbi:MAG: alpha/beta-hydrolase [Acidobacteria bacterium]|nr:alpha/beta-hydrolase [Acidobacteriota bacterium]